MPNPNPKLENLKSYQPKWQSGKTRTIRVPVAIADQVLEIAHQIDEGKFTDTSEFSFINESKKLKKGNISDTSESSHYTIKKILLEALAVKSNQGAKIKTKIAELGEFFDWKIEKANKNAAWTITDTSEK